MRFVPRVSTVVSELVVVNDNTAISLPVELTGEPNPNETFSGSEIAYYSAGFLNDGAYTLQFRLADFGTEVAYQGGVVRNEVVSSHFVVSTAYFRFSGVMVCGTELHLSFSENLGAMPASPLADLVTVSAAGVPLNCSVAARSQLDGRIGGDILILDCPALPPEPFVPLKFFFSSDFKADTGKTLGDFTGEPIPATRFVAEGQPIATTSSCSSFSVRAMR